MARSRNIKPGFFTNPELAECSPHARLLFIGLWLLADREGRLKDRPKHIKVHIFPCDDVDVDSLLGELHSRGFAIRYEALGKRCVWLPTFTRHQNPHKNEVPSDLPEFSAETSRIAPRCERSENIASTPAESISISPILKPESALPIPEVARATYIPPEISMAFDEVFSAYPPSRRNKREALPVFAQMQLHACKADILAGIDRSKRSEEWRREKGRFIPAMDKYLESRGWEAQEFAEVRYTKGFDDL